MISERANETTNRAGEVGGAAARKDDVPPQLSSRPAEGEAAFRAAHERKPLMLSRDRRMSESLEDGIFSKLETRRAFVPLKFFKTESRNCKALVERVENIDGSMNKRVE